MSRCRCHSRKRAKRCCGPYHEGKAAPTPEALMRSRYAAYAQGLVDYVIDTTDPTGPQWQERQAFAAQIRQFCEQTDFQGLTIVEAPPAQGDEGFVTFTAQLSRGAVDTSFTERSRFTRRDGRWYYHSGEPG